MGTTNSLLRAASRLSKFVVVSGKVLKSTRMLGVGPLVVAEKITPSLLSNQYQFEVVVQLKTNILNVQINKRFDVLYLREFRALVRYHGSDTIFAETEDGEVRKILPGKKVGLIIRVPAFSFAENKLPQYFTIYRLADSDNLVLEEIIAPFVL